jgi:hypothetical protein
MSRIAVDGALAPAPSTPSPITTSTLRLPLSLSSSATPALSPAASARCALGPVGPGVSLRLASSASGTADFTTVAASAYVTTDTCEPLGPAAARLTKAACTLSAMSERPWFASQLPSASTTTTMPIASGPSRKGTSFAALIGDEALSPCLSA